MAKILVTGGAGYIGSHTCVELLNAGHDVIVFDNLSNSSEESLRRVQKLANRSLVFVQGDIRDANALDQLLNTENAFLLEVKVAKEDNVFPMVPTGASVAEIRLQ